MARAEEACSPSGPGGWCDVFAVENGWISDGYYGTRRVMADEDLLTAG